MRREEVSARVRAWFRHLGSLINPRSGAFALERTGAVVGLALLILVFAAVSSPFRQPANLVFLAKNVAITIGFVAIGQTIVMISGGIDLSVSSVIALTALVMASLMRHGLGLIPPLDGSLSYLAILIGWGLGAVIGASQGWLINRYQIPAFIVTLATMLGLRGIAIGISGAIVYGLPTNFRWLSEGKVWFLPVPFLLMLGLYVVTAYMLRRTKIGRYCHAIGGNETAARLSGIDVGRYRVLFYAMSGLTAAITATLLISNLNAAIYSHGEGYQFTSVAATVIGGTSLTGGVGGIWGTLLGVFILAIIPSGMIMLNAPPWSRDVVTAIIIILAVIIDVDRTRARQKAPAPSAGQQPAAGLEPAGGSASAGYHLADVLSKLTQKVEKATNAPLSRVYLVDRETGDLVPQQVLRSDKPGAASLAGLGRSRIVSEARESAAPVVLPDLTRSGYSRVTPISADVQSALAAPILRDDRCIGVIELQSPNAGSLKESGAQAVCALASPAARSLEDAWLLESGWLGRQVRDALRHLWDDLYLGKLPLAEWLLATGDGAGATEPTAGARGEAIRNALLAGIESLKPQENHDPARTPRTYRILRLTYVDEQAIEQILRTLNISRRQYFYDLKDSIEVLTDLLVRNHH
jgi:ribose transport system permease protein